MPLWMMAVILVLVAVMVFFFFLLMQRKGKKPWIVASMMMSSLLLLAGVIYVLITVYFTGITSGQPADDLLASSEKTISSATQKQTDSPTVEAMPKPDATDEISTADGSAVPESSSTPESNSTPDALSSPEEKNTEAFITGFSEPYPDITGIKHLVYEEKPVFSSQNEVTQYVLHHFLNGCFEFEFYLTKDFAIDEGTGFSILDRACETAMSYYLFSAYNVTDMFTEDEDDGKTVFARIHLVYTEPGYDSEALARAQAFVLENPAPVGGFEDYEREKAYAKTINDYIAKKVTYSPIGYDPEKMFGLQKYEALQEAYNVLGDNEHMAVCAAYARTFALIAQHAGINTAWVMGNETDVESHAWNVIFPCDGSEAVVVDVTWNDTSGVDVPEQDYVSDQYFYVPVSEDTEHVAAAYFDDFLQFVDGSN